MTAFFEELLFLVSIMYIVYLVVFATYSFLAVSVGAYVLFMRDRMLMLSNKLEHTYIPISIIVPAYNEEVTIVNSVKSLLQIEYHLYEIIVVDDGSVDATSQAMIDEFDMRLISRPINLTLNCKPENAIYEKEINGVKITLINKQNGGKGDALNMGINVCRFPYFICVDADSKLQKDSLEKIIQPIMEDETVISVGGMIQLSQCVRWKNGNISGHYFPRNWIVCMQAVEYDRSFLSSRILFDTFNGNLVISGAFGIFEKATAIAAGGYSVGNLGEDMELVLKLHVYCRNNNIKYRMRYEPTAICLTQAPTTLKDLIVQRRRWHLGLFQSMMKHRSIFFNTKFGKVGFLSYMYYLFYELLAPFIEFLGILFIILASYMELLNYRFMIMLFALYAVYGGILSLTSFSQHIYINRFKLSFFDIIKAMLLCVFEFGVFRHIFVVVRIMAFLKYQKNKMAWGKIKRV